MNKYIGDRKFYKKIMYVAVPIMIQNGMTNFVNFLDNMMVGRLGTEQMTGVAIVNQIIFVFNLCIFGAISGAGIFSAQYFGKKDINGVRNTFRYKMWITTIILSIAIAIFIVRGSDIIMLYLKTSSEDIVVADTLIYGKKYLGIMIFGMPAFIITQLYASTLREAGETVVPMAAGVSAVVTDCLLNYVLIYGKLGCPARGVEGAAVATTIARYIETLNIDGNLWYGDSYKMYAQWVSPTVLELKVDGYKTLAWQAKELHTSRTIWGQSFDGTGNVS